MEKAPLVQRNWFVILMLIICFPVGLYLMWKQRKWDKNTRVVITISWIVYVVLSACFYGKLGVFKDPFGVFKIWIMTITMFLHGSSMYYYSLCAFYVVCFVISVLLFVWIGGLLGLYLMWHKREQIKWPLWVCSVITTLVSPLILFCMMWWSNI